MVVKRSDNYPSIVSLLYTITSEESTRIFLKEGTKELEAT